MLLQGFACDPAPGARRSLASPPATPPQLSAPNAFGNLVNSCRSLQALLQAPVLQAPAPAAASSAASSASSSSTTTPSPMKLRLRARKADGSADLSRRIVKRQPARGHLKRRRSNDDNDDASSDDELARGGDSSSSSSDDELAREPAHGLLLASPAFAPVSLQSPFTPSPSSQPSSSSLPSSSQPSSSTSSSFPLSTPKRARIAPETLPLGLDRADFHALHADGIPDDSMRAGTDVEHERDGSAWGIEDDRMLVELVLAKLQLSREEWQDCARTLGRDRASLGRRWKSLVLHGAVGLKGGRTRTRGRV